MTRLEKAVSKATSQAERNLLVASSLCARLREQGWDTVVVGGSALEFYTHGGCVARNIDLCRARGVAPIPASVELKIMSEAGATSVGVRRQWILAGVVVDLLGEVETVGKSPFRTLEGPFGNLAVMPAEEVLVERVFMAYANRSSKPNRSALGAAKQLIRAALTGAVTLDWEAVYAIAAGKEYDNLEEVTRLRDEVAKSLPKRSGPGKKR